MVDQTLPESISDPENRDWPPLMEWREFADWIRVRRSIVEGWIRLAYIPTFKIGRHRLVNVARLIEQIQEGEFS